MATPSLKLNCLTTAGSSIFSVDENAGNITNLTTFFNNTTVSSSSTSGSVIFLGGISISSTTNASNNSVGGALTIAGGASVTQDLFANRISTGSFGAPGGTIGTLYFTSLTGANIAISGNATIGGDLLVLGQTTIVNLTTSNQIETNVTSSNIFLIQSLIAGYNTHTLGNIFTTGGNVGINTTAPSYKLHLNGPNSSLSGPHIYATNNNSTYPIFQQLNWDRNNLGMSFDMYYDGAWRTSSTSSGFQIYKLENRLNFNVHNNSAGSQIPGGTLNTVMAIGSTGNIGISTTAPAFTLDVSGTARFTSGVTAQTLLVTSNISTGVLNATNITTTNAVFTGISSSSIVSNNLVSTVNLQVTNVSAATLQISGNISAGSSVATIGTLYTNISTTGTLFINTSITTPSILATTNISSAAIYTLNQTTINAVFTSITTANMRTTNSITVPNILATTSLSTANVYSTNITSTNLVSNFTSLGNLISSTGTVENIVVTSSANLSGNTNTIGNIFTTNGNVGINTTSPSFTIDILGNSRISVSLTTGSIYSTNITSTNIVSTNISSSTLNSTTSTIPNIVHTNISTSTLVIPTYISYSGNFTGFSTNVTGANSRFSIINVVNSTASNQIQLYMLGAPGQGNQSQFQILSSYGSMYSLSSISTGGGANYPITISHNLIPYLTVQTNGNVGIATTTPGFTLDVVGTSRISNSQTIGSILVITNGNLSGNSNTIGSLFTTGGNVGINTTSPAFTLDVFGTARITDSLTTSSVYSTNITSTNIVGTNCSLSNLNVSNFSTLANSFITAITASGLIVTGITCGNAYFTSNITTGGLFSTNITASGLFTTFITSGTLNVTGITAGTILATVGLTTNSLLATTSTFPNTFLTNSTLTNTFISNSTVTNQRVSNSSITNLIVSSSASLLFNSNTIGTSLFTTGGNVGINTTSPGFTLDVSGSARINNSTVYSSNSTTGALNILGGISIKSTNSSSTTAGGGLTIDGGGAISQDLYLGGNLFVQGTNVSPITDNVLIGSISGTGVYQQTITFSRTMANTTYKIIGNLTSVSANTNVYALTFTSLTTTSCNVNIYRVDALGGGSNLSDLTLSFIIFP